MNLIGGMLLCTIFLICSSLPVFSQTKHGATYTLELLPSEPEGLKVYKIKENDLKKMRIPKNYILVKRPAEDTLYLWEIPGRIPRLEIAEKTEEKKETGNVVNPSPDVGKTDLFELSKKLGIR
ncbi:MAG: hypothetical protein N2596_06715 [Syntrophorhabdaceae bacterium]|nr:hypothetical protein [Syntrophorhabdaceae bacterium]